MTGKHSFLIAGGPVSSLSHGEYSMGPTPSSLPTPKLAPCVSCKSSSSPSFPLMWLSTSQPLAYCSSPHDALLSSLPGSLCPVKPDRLVPRPPPKDCPVKPDRPVPSPPKQSQHHPSPFCSRGLTSGAEVSVPSPLLSVSIFGDCASSSDDLLGSRSAFQYSDLLLYSFLHLEICRFS